MESNNFLNNNIKTWEGRCLQPSDDKALYEAIGYAFDYRGDVTIQLKTGEQVMGYVFDRHEDVPQPYIRLFRPNQHQPHKIFYQEIAGIVFSGADTAFGRSWEDWAKKWKKLE
jgi:hypothetical protein